MTRIRLYVEQSLRTGEETVADNQGQQLRLPFLRLFSLIRIAGRPDAPQECLIDTGAPLTVFPLVRWEPFAGTIEWLTVAADRTTPSWLTRLRGRTGGVCPCRVGRVSVVAFDLERPSRSLPPVLVVAQFEEEDTGDDRIITGLHGSILEGRRLILEPDLRQAWLEER